MRRGFLAAGLAIICLSVTNNDAKAATAFHPLDITYNFIQPVSASVQNAFDEAEIFWESIITDFRFEDVNYTSPVTQQNQVFTGTSQRNFFASQAPTMVIDVTVGPIDNAGGVLGFAGPSSASNIVLNSPSGQLASSPYAYSFSGAMTFDDADVSNLQAAGLFEAVVVHEISHVLGYGTLWNANSLLDGNGDYIGGFGVSAYQNEFNPGSPVIPVEDEGGQGTAGGHWDETFEVPGSNGVNAVDGPSFEILTGFLESYANPSSFFLSETSRQSFIDLGYELAAGPIPSIPSFPITNDPTPVPVPAGIVLLLSGLGIFGLVRRFRPLKAA